MAEGGERTAAEREAARRERERRRHGVYGETDFPDPFAELADDGAAAGRRQPPAPDPGATQAWELPDEPAFGPEADDGDDRAEPPSGTRRVSRLPADGTRPAPPRRRAATPARRPRRRTPARTARRARTARAGLTGGAGVVGGPHRRRHSWLGRIVALVALVVVAIVIFLAVEIYQPFGTSPHGRVTVVVPAHTGARQIGDLLAREGVVPSGLWFDVRAALAGDRGKLLSGTYHLQQGMSYGAALTALMTAPPAAKTTDLTIIPGHTRQQVAALLRKQGIRGNYLADTRHSPVLRPQSYGAPPGAPLEGFLFPDTFRLVVPVKMTKLVDDQLQDFKQHFATVDLSYARSHHLTAYDVLKIASLIEGEAATPHDLPLVSSVIYNRLHDGMLLGMDSTTRYATGNFTKPLTQSELNSPSPYNTRTHAGLPPTPIDSPGLAEIKAAAHPAHSDYLYFFTKPCTNRSVFTSSYTQFLNLLAADRRDHCP